MKTKTISPVIQGGRACKFCGEPMGDARENKEYCGNSCRAKQRRMLVAEKEKEDAIRLRLLESMQGLGAAPSIPIEDGEADEPVIDPEELARIEGIMAAIKVQEEVIASKEAEIAKIAADLEAQLVALPSEIEAVDAEIQRLSGFLQYDRVEFYNRCMNKELAALMERVKAGNLPMDFHDLIYPALHRKALVVRIDEGGELWQVTEDGRRRLLQMIASKEEARQRLEVKLQAARKSKDGPQFQSYVHKLAADAARARIKELQRKLEEVPPPKPPKAVAPVLPFPVLSGLPSQEYPAGLVVARPHHPSVQSQAPEPRRQKVSKGEAGAADIVAAGSQSFMLEGELGAFLGEMDRHMVAIGLTGCSGGGKSTFSLTLAGLFARQGLTVKYFSIEEGLGKSMIAKIKAARLGNDVRMSDGGSLAAVRQDAKRFDVIFIDSYTNLNVGQDELERLRKDFPETIFVCIHQKTTAGSIRGGSMIFYNSTAIIDIRIDKERGRLAVMEKSRYGTQGCMYAINEGEMYGPGEW